MKGYQVFLSCQHLGIVHTAFCSRGTDIGMENPFYLGQMCKLVHHPLMQQGLYDELVCEINRKVPFLLATLYPVKCGSMSADIMTTCETFLTHQWTL